MARQTHWYVKAFVVVSVIAVVAGVTTAADAPQTAVTIRPSVASKIHARLAARFAEGDDVVKTWVFFTDKGIASPAEYSAAIARVAADYNSRALERRALRGKNGPARRSAVRLPRLAARIRLCGCGHRDRRRSAREQHVAQRRQCYTPRRSRWMKSPTCRSSRRCSRSHVRRASIRRPVPRRLRNQCRRRLRSVLRSTMAAPSRSSKQMNLVALHDAGYTGQGVIIGILDTGFRPHARGVQLPRALDQRHCRIRFHQQRWQCRHRARRSLPPSMTTAPRR